MRVARFVVPVLCTILAACGPDAFADNDGPLDDVGTVSLEARTRITPRAVSFEIPANKGKTETRKLFKSASTFDKFFGRGSAETAGIDFAREWAVFYSAGVQSTGGYAATIAALEVSENGRTLYVTTRLESPGEGCLVTMALTKPGALVAFRRPPTNPGSNRYLKDDAVTDCATGCESDADCGADEWCADGECRPEISCKTAKCSAGFHCVMEQVMCIRAPCPAAMPHCVEDAKTCDEIACGNGWYCVERDGLAECVERQVTCAHVRCAARTYCSEAFGEAECIPFSTCANVRCARGYSCEDVPNDQCESVSCPPTRPVCR